LDPFWEADGARIDEKRCWENHEKTMTTKMAKKSNIGAYGCFRRHDFGARGGGGRRGKPLLQRSWRKLEDQVVSWKLKLEVGCVVGCWMMCCKLLDDVLMRKA